MIRVWQLSAEDLRNVYMLVGHCCGLGTDAIAWRAHMLEQLALLLRGDVAIYLHAFRSTSDRGGRQFVARTFLHWNWPAAPKADRLFDANLQGFCSWLCGPRLGHLFDQTSLLTSRRQDVMSLAEWHQSAAYKHHAQASGLDEWLLSASLETKDELRVFATLRRHGEGPFTARERSMLGLFWSECALRFGSQLSEDEALSIGDLPRRATEVLLGLLDGSSEKQLAQNLGISRNTVHCYVKKLYEHFGASTRAELLATCHRHQSVLAAYTVSRRLNRKPRFVPHHNGHAAQSRMGKPVEPS